MVSHIYIHIPYLVKWFCVNFSKSGILRHKSEYFFCASDFLEIHLHFYDEFCSEYFVFKKAHRYALWAFLSR